MGEVKYSRTWRISLTEKCKNYLKLICEDQRSYRLNNYLGRGHQNQTDTLQEQKTVVTEEKIWILKVRKYRENCQSQELELAKAIKI